MGTESPENLRIMRKIDELYLSRPFYGSPRMTDWLRDLVAVMDWFSRYVLSWALSNSLETDFCLRALECALAHATPGIFNTDQGAQFTSEEFTGRLTTAGIRISMDGRGRALDNVFIERLWKSVKYEEVYLRDYKDGHDARMSLGRYFRMYNTERRHQSLGKRTPEDVHFSQRREFPPPRGGVEGPPRKGVYKERRTSLV